jgi:hypothetical protein
MRRNRPIKLSLLLSDDAPLGTCLHSIDDSWRALSQYYSEGLTGSFGTSL